MKDIPGSIVSESYEAVREPVFDQTILAADILVPEIELLLDGRFRREGDDLAVTGRDGRSWTIEDYFSHDPPPVLTAPNGALMLPETVAALLDIDPLSGAIQVAGPNMAPGSSPNEPGATQVPSSPPATPSAQPSVAIGTVGEMTGQVSVKGGDGVERPVKTGDVIFKGDVVQTTKGGLIKITFTDGTIFQLGEEARSILDKYVYDPEGKKGGFEATVTKGIFSFQSGAISGLNAGRHSTIKTPTAVIGIRGSQLSGEVTADGSTTVVHTAGILDISDARGQGTVTLIEPGTATQVVLGAGAPQPVFKAPASFLSRLEGQLDIQKFKEEQGRNDSKDATSGQEQKPEGGKEPAEGEPGPREGSGEGTPGEPKGATEDKNREEEKSDATDALEGTDESLAGDGTFSLADLIDTGGGAEGLIAVEAVGETLNTLLTTSVTNTNPVRGPETGSSSSDVPFILAGNVANPEGNRKTGTETVPEPSPATDPEVTAPSSAPLETVEESGEPELDAGQGLADLLGSVADMATNEIMLSSLSDTTTTTDTPTRPIPESTTSTPAEPDFSLGDLLGGGEFTATPGTTDDFSSESSSNDTSVSPPTEEVAAVQPASSPDTESLVPVGETPSPEPPSPTPPSADEPPSTTTEGTGGSREISDSRSIFINAPPTGSVLIEGLPAQGETLRASHTLADADGLGTILIEWFTNDEAIVGATGPVLVLTEAQVGKTVTAAARYTDGHGVNERVVGSATTTVANRNDAPTGLVTIQGSHLQGATLAAVQNLADADGLGALNYRWRANGEEILAATGSTLALTQDQVGKVITVNVYYTDGHGTGEYVASTATGSIANINDAPTGSVTISGTATQGRTLTVTHSLADADGLGAITFFWSANGTPISGATGATLTLTQNEVGKVITATANYTDSFNATERVVSAATHAVVNINDPPTSADTTQTTAEDTPFVFGADQFEFIDIDSPTLARLIIVTPPSAGRLQTRADGDLWSDVAEGQAIDRATLDAGELRYFPDENQWGMEIATFQFRVNDGEDDSAEIYSVTLNVTPVNDAPVSVASSMTLTRGSIGTTVTATHLRASDVDNDAGGLVYTLTSLPTQGGLYRSATLLAMGDTFTQTDIDNGLLTYNHFGGSALSDTIGYSLADGVGGLTQANTFDITVTPSTAPTGIRWNPVGAGGMAFEIAAGNALVHGLGGAVGFGEETFEATDDSYWMRDVSTVFAHGFNFLGTRYDASTQFYVGSNGYVTFGSGSSEYVRYPMSQSVIPMIAGHFHDIDTRNGGSIHLDLETLNDARVVTITYSDVAPYSDSYGTGVNNFQIRLHDLENGAFGIELRYASMSWNIDGTAGWSAGTGQEFDHVTGSGSTAMIDAPANSNIDHPGVFAWVISDTSQAGNTYLHVVEEATAGTVVATLTGIDPDVDDALTLSLVDDDQGHFELIDNDGVWQLRVKEGEGIHHGEAANRSIVVQVTDEAGLIHRTNMNITVHQKVTDTDNAIVHIVEDAAIPASANIRVTPDTLIHAATQLVATEARILSVTGGTLTRGTDGSAITPGGAGTLLSLTDGHLDLRFTPTANRDINATFGYALVNPANSNEHFGNAIAEVIITAVNDVPLAGGDGTVTDPSGGSVSIVEDSPTPSSANIRFELATLAEVDSGQTPTAIRILAVTGGALAQGDGSSITFGTNGTVLTLNDRHLDLRFTPGTNQATDATFTYVVVDAIDSTLNSAASTATIPITAVNDAPTATQPASLSTNEDTPLSITLAGTDPENDPLTCVIVSGPSSGTLSGSGANRVYTPNANFNGSDSFSFKVNDGTVDSATIAVPITIVSVNDAPVASNVSASTTSGQAVAVTLAATDVEGNPLTYSLVTSPSHGTLSGSGANRTYTPSASWSGTDTFTYVANDGTTNSNTATATLTVTSSSPTAIGTWLLNGNANDSVGSYHGTVTLATPTVNYNGSSNKAYHFSSSVNDYINIPLDLNANVLPQLTLTAWVKADTPTAGRQTILSHDNGGYDRGMGIDLVSGNGKWTTNTGAAGSGVLLSTENVSTGWTFLASVYDEAADTVKLYVNGSLSATASTNMLMYPGLSYFHLGKNPTWGEAFNGSIDNVRIYNQALTAADINTLFNQGVTDPIVLDLDGDGIELLSATTQENKFSMSPDGTVTPRTWVHPDDGFLVLDRNDNGQVDDITELFSKYFSPVATTGGEALATLDANGDGRLDPSDPGFSRLSVWKDLDSDGITTPGELSPLSQWHIAAISLETEPVHAVVEGGLLLSQGTMVTTEGQSLSFVEVALHDREAEEPTQEEDATFEQQFYTLMESIEASANSGTLPTPPSMPVFDSLESVHDSHGSFWPLGLDDLVGPVPSEMTTALAMDLPDSGWDGLPTPILLDF
ncbi:MAG: tandem-95 repeat protein [Magnetococcales bacterium]|nr:tandem-95 repeat protein [Magnetococcales bacterium]